MSKRSEQCQNCLLPAGSHHSSLHKERPTQPVLAHRCRRRCRHLPDACLVPVLQGTLSSVLRRSASPDELLQKIVFFVWEQKVSSVLFRYGSESKKSSQGGLARLKFFVFQSRLQPALSFDFCRKSEATGILAGPLPKWTALRH